MNLYPFIFKTIYKEKIWGGEKIRTILGKDFSPLSNCGETWEISGVRGNESIVENGRLRGRTLSSLIEEFNVRLVGKKSYKKYGNEFPLLIKFIDANDDLSIQVHPDDDLAKRRHDCFGKTEMWYIFQADEGSKLNSGFKSEIDKDSYISHLKNNSLNEILNFEEVKVGDVFFLPAGRIHYIGKGICLAEIQQTSDVTYRIYDFDRVDDEGNKRELHTEFALDALNFTHYNEYKTKYNAETDKPVELVKCCYFTTNLLTISNGVNRNYSDLDSFIIYVCVEGEGMLNYTGGEMPFRKGDSILIPAELKEVKIKPDCDSKILEVHL